MKILFFVLLNINSCYHFILFFHFLSPVSFCFYQTQNHPMMPLIAGWTGIWTASLTQFCLMELGYGDTWLPHTHKCQWTPNVCFRESKRMKDYRVTVGMCWFVCVFGCASYDRFTQSTMKKVSKWVCNFLMRLIPHAERDGDQESYTKLHTSMRFL